MNDVALLTTIELCAGVGMLGEGLRAGLDYMGAETRAVCYVEREASAGAVLAARMEEGSLDGAPIWTDLTTFNARAFYGKVDCVVAGFPCQDLSLAGRRAGLDGKRSGLFFEVVRIATDSGAWSMLLENVAGIHSATASVVDEEEGELEERAAARVLGELADLGWDAEWITLPASDVGASHNRSRWFCWAWLATARAEDSEAGGNHPGAVDSLTGATKAWATPNVCSPNSMRGFAQDPAKRLAQGHQVNLQDQASYWLTPNVPSGGRSVPAELVASNGKTDTGEKRTVGLESQTRFWPTPSAAVMNDGESPETWHARAAKLKAKHGNGNGAGLPLTVASVQWPTPASRDFKGANSAEHALVTGGGRKHMDQLANFVAYSPRAQAILRGQESLLPNLGEPQPSASKKSTTPRLLSRRLNPYFVEWLMGWPRNWTSITVRHVSGRAETELWRRNVRQQLCNLFDGQE